MDARVKPDCRFAIVQAGSREYVSYEWRRVPPGHEAEVQASEDLEVREPVAVVKEIAEPDEPVTVQEAPAATVEPPAPEPPKKRPVKRQAWQ